MVFSGRSLKSMLLIFKKVLSGMGILSKMNNVIFAEKMDLLIGYYNNLLSCYNFEGNRTILGILLKKLITNLSSANILIFEGYLNESQIVLRSAIETVVLFVYLSEFPEKIDEYNKDGELLYFKNHFMVFKSIQNDPTLKEEHEQLFGKLCSENKDRILKKLKLTEYKLDEEYFNKLDKYFKNFKPFFMKLEQMYKDLKVKNKKITGDLDLREVVYIFYNQASQITHGRLQDWAFSKDTKHEIENLFSFMRKSIDIPLLTLKEVIKIDPKEKEEADKLKKLLRREYYNIGKWVYKDKKMAKIFMTAIF